VAYFLGNLLLKRYPALVASRYGFDISGMDGVGLVEKIATKRAWRKKGGALDIEKAAMALLKDYRTGVTGNISLETPQSREEMIAEARAAKPVKDVNSPDPQEEIVLEDVNKAKDSK
jgi:ribosome biogenesis GTPase A